MKSKETESIKEVNKLLKKGWRIYKVENDKVQKIIFWLIKD